MQRVYAGAALTMCVFLSACDGGARRADNDTTRVVGIQRYQVVNGMPATARNIMLLDTQTGRSWLICDVRDTTTTAPAGWCAMDFYGIGTMPGPSKESLDADLRKVREHFDSIRAKR